MRMRYLKDVVTLRLEAETCIGCSLCVEVCPHRVFVVEERKCRIADRDACMECGACARNCPVGALWVKRGMGCAVGMLNSALGRKSACCGEDQECCGGDIRNNQKESESMDEKTKEMIAIGASVGAHCQPCLEYHVTKGREVGLTDDEIREAIGVGHMVEKGSMAAMKQFSTGILDVPTKPASGGCCCPGSAPAKKSGCC